jgi:hypothetical protein
MRTIRQRLANQRKDPWSGYAAAARQPLKTAAIEAVAEE